MTIENRVTRSRLFHPANLIAILFLLASTQGCSVVMAAKQPGKKDLSVLDKGTPRAMVLAELGQPTATEVREGVKVDVFSFVQGYDKVNKGIRTAGHAVGDVLTLGLWEVVGTPTEMVSDGDKLAYEVTYDHKDAVEHALLLKKKVFAGDTK